MSDRQERPIAYAYTLTVVERAYSQIETESLAVVYTVTKFYNYLYGRKFLIELDHQPLSHLFDQQKIISTTASARIQGLALTLSAYHYTICYKPGRSFSNANASSHLPRPITTSAVQLPRNLVHLLAGPSVNNYTQCCLHTDADPVLYLMSKSFAYKVA